MKVNKSIVILYMLCTLFSTIDVEENIENNGHSGIKRQVRNNKLTFLKRLSNILKNAKSKFTLLSLSKNPLGMQRGSLLRSDLGHKPNTFKTPLFEG